MSLTKAHAYGATMTHPDDARLSHLYMRRANELLQAAPPAAAGADCAIVDGQSQGWGDWLYYVALQIDGAKAVVYPTGLDIPAADLLVRDTTGCNVMGTRVYTLPGGRPVLSLLTSVS